MKKIFLIGSLFFVALTALQSCAPKTTSGVVALKRSNVIGIWGLTKITLEGIPETAVKSFFGETSYLCFLKSSWELNNSGNGYYRLPTSQSCAAKKQTIFWTVSPADETFQFKKVANGVKPKDITDGYRLILSATDGKIMVLKSPIEYGTKVAYIVLSFKKLE